MDVNFPDLFRPALGPTQLLHSAYQAIPRGKMAGVLRWPPTPL
jgi:hypothetical protein